VLRKLAAPAFTQHSALSTKRPICGKIRRFHPRIILGSLKLSHIVGELPEGMMKELVGIFMLLYSLGQVALDREKPEQFLYKLERFSKGKCVTTGQYIPADKTKAGILSAAANSSLHRFCLSRKT
jgi:hypothetical protein